MTFVGLVSGHFLIYRTIFVIGMPVIFLKRHDYSFRNPQRPLPFSFERHRGRTLNSQDHSLGWTSPPQRNTRGDHYSEEPLVSSQTELITGVCGNGQPLDKKWRVLCSHERHTYAVLLGVQQKKKRNKTKNLTQVWLHSWDGNPVS